MKRFISLVLVVSLIMSFGVAFASDTDCAPCEAGSNVQVDRVIGDGEMDVLTQALMNQDVIQASRRAEYRFDANSAKVFTSEDFQLVTMHLISKDKAIENASMLFYAFDIASETELVFKFSAYENEIVMTDYTNGTETSTQLIAWEDGMEYSNGEESMSCEAKCNALVGGLGCSAFCALFGAGFSACGSLCAAVGLLFCSDFCTPSGPWIPPQLPDCGLEGLPDCPN